MPTNHNIRVPIINEGGGLFYNMYYMQNAFPPLAPLVLTQDISPYALLSRAYPLITCKTWGFQQIGVQTGAQPDEGEGPVEGPIGLQVAL